MDVGAAQMQQLLLAAKRRPACNIFKLHHDLFCALGAHERAHLHIHTHPYTCAHQSTHPCATPQPVVERFLSEVQRHGEYRGYCSLGIVFQVGVAAPAWRDPAAGSLGHPPVFVVMSCHPPVVKATHSFL
jgi:hypothetical protein